MNLRVYGSVTHCMHAWSCTAIMANSRFCFSAYWTEFISLCWLYPETSTVGAWPMVIENCFEVTPGLTDMVTTFSRRVWFIIPRYPFTHSTNGLWNFHNQASLPTEYSTMILTSLFEFTIVLSVSQTHPRPLLLAGQPEAPSHFFRWRKGCKSKPASLVNLSTNFCINYWLHFGLIRNISPTGW